MENLRDQVSIAFSCQNYFKKWGNHYLLSFVRSLQLQIKNNFKDPGVAHFGGSLFNSFVDKADEIFNDMPPPKPTKAKQQKNFVPVKSMRCYNSNSAPCFDGSCHIKMEDGSLKPVHSLE